MGRIKMVTPSGVDIVYVHCIDCAEKNMRLAKLEAELEDWHDTNKLVLQDCGAPDEKHCTCVPFLRKRLAELGADLTCARIEESGMEIKYEGQKTRADRAEEKLAKLEAELNKERYVSQDARNDNEAIHRELDRLGAPRRQDSGFGYSPLGRLRVVAVNECGKGLKDALMRERNEAQAKVAELEADRDMWRNRCRVWKTKDGVWVSGRDIVFDGTSKRFAQEVAVAWRKHQMFVHRAGDCPCLYSKYYAYRCECAVDAPPAAAGEAMPVDELSAGAEGQEE